MDVSKKIAKHLLQIKAIKLNPNNPFTWASGIESPIYCDNRLVLSFPDVRKLVKKELAILAKQFGAFDAVSGVATAGIAHGMLLADEVGKPFSYVRSKPKGHGRQNLVEGLVESGQKVLVVEDLISTGGSSVKAVEALRERGVEVVGVIAIFTYGFQKAIDTFSDANCLFKTLSNYDDLIETAVDLDYVSESDTDMLKKWREQFV
ncbi:MAG: orotate phosphoribosyltransferase [Saprospiraceae bacterium]|nr:orotate phosphoribosyltransferase [Saprospiraceae bacterium]